MESYLAALVTGLERNQSAPAGLLDQVQAGLHTAFPEDYSEFMTESNGAEGNVGENSYLVLWPLEEIIPLNEAYAVKEFAPGLVLFGSDGGDTGYAFDTRGATPVIVDVPFIGMSLEEARPRGRSLRELLAYLYSA